MRKNIAWWWLLIVIPAFAIGWMGGQLHAHPITITYPDSYKAGYDDGIADANEGLLNIVPLLIISASLIMAQNKVKAPAEAFHAFVWVA